MIQWVSLSRQEIPALIASGQIPILAKKVDGPIGCGDQIFVGSFSAGSMDADIIVIDDELIRETLAWVATYSSNTFPLTQSTRVLSVSDFGNFNAPRMAPSRSGIHHQLWPNIVLGELLGQGEQIKSVDTAQISRVHACFSFAAARADYLYADNPTSFSTCEGRLFKLGGDGLFSRRSISVADLSPIWHSIQTGSSDKSSPIEILSFIQRFAESESSGSASAEPFSFRVDGLDVKSLSTGPVENRVRAFESFLSRMSGLRNDAGNYQTMLLAAAAFFVGNGTSHVSLLDEVGRDRPEVFAWFGLFVGAAGPKFWDSSWNRAINSVDRLLRNRFELLDPPTSDLSWAEYEFLRDVARPAEFLKSFPRLSSRSLSIEIAPGVACQLRIKEESTNSKVNVQTAKEAIKPAIPQPTTLDSAALARLAMAMADIERVVSRSQSLVRHVLEDASRSIQTSFVDLAPEDKKKSSSRKGSKSKRPVE